MFKSCQNIFGHFRHHSEVFGKSSEIFGSGLDDFGNSGHEKKNLTRLTQKKLAGILYVNRCIHGLSFMPTHFENAKLQDQLQLDVTTLNEQYKTNQRTLVAYKGGHIERDLLNELDILSVNMEEIGCPKVMDLIHLGCGLEVWDCEHHLGTGIAHCSMAECHILLEWIIFKMNQLKKKTMNELTVNFYC